MGPESGQRHLDDLGVGAGQWAFSQVVAGTGFEPVKLSRRFYRTRQSAATQPYYLQKRRQRTLLISDPSAMCPPAATTLPTRPGGRCGPVARWCLTGADSSHAVAHRTAQVRLTPTDSHGPGSRNRTSVGPPARSLRVRHTPHVTPIQGRYTSLVTVREGSRLRWPVAHVACGSAPHRTGGVLFLDDARYTLLHHIPWWPDRLGPDDLVIGRQPR